MPEGTVFFAEEPILQVIAPLPEAQIVETRLINLLHFQTAIASKAVRSVLAAPGKLLVEFGLRRAHGAEAALMAARASYLAGFQGTSNVLAGKLFGIPLFGTMAHSFIQAHEDEMTAFEHFADANSRDIVLLIDSYDIEAAAAKVVQLAPTLKERDIRINGVRIDSGDLGRNAAKVRGILDEAGLRDVTIFASGDIDEYGLRELVGNKVPIDGFGIGTRLDTLSDAPYLECAYKLQEYADRPRRKRSEGKASWPGRKQVFRRLDRFDRLASDILTLSHENAGSRAFVGPRHARRQTARQPSSAAGFARVYREPTRAGCQIACGRSNLPNLLKSPSPSRFGTVRMRWMTGTFRGSPVPLCTCSVNSRSQALNRPGVIRLPGIFEAIV